MLFTSIFPVLLHIMPGIQQKLWDKQQQGKYDPLSRDRAVHVKNLVWMLRPMTPVTHWEGLKKLITHILKLYKEGMEGS